MPSRRPSGKAHGELAARPDHGPGRGNPRQRGRAQRALHAAHDASTGSGDNSYRAGEALSWHAGAQHSLPTGYADFLARLQASENGTVGYRTEDGASFVCGTALSALDAVLYISAPLGVVGAAAGIPPQELPHIRKRYFTARERGGRGGTGLGLAIVGELLTACGARFGAQNVQDAGESGCIFWFELPACADSPDAMPRSSEDDVLEPGKAENTACD